MSYHVFFDFSTGLSKPITVPKGTLESIIGRIEYTEKTLGLQRTPAYVPEGKRATKKWYWRNPGNDMNERLGPEPSREGEQWWLAHREREAIMEKMATAVRLHNQDVRGWYADFGKKHQGKTEKITPKAIEPYWGGLTMLSLPFDIWTKDHYKEHIQHIGRLLISGEDEGVYLDCKLKPAQAQAVLNLIDVELDQFFKFDVRAALTLDANLKHTHCVGFSDDGGYDWCAKCGPIDSDSFYARCRACPHAKKGKCDLKNERPEEFEGEDDK